MYDYHKRADRVANDLVRAWVDSANYINDEMTSIFRTFRTDGGLTEEEAKQLLNNLPDKAKLTDLKAVINAVDDPQKKRELLNVINSPAYAWRIERLERLQEDIDAQTSQLAGVELSTTREHYIELANEAYHRTMFDIQRGTGYGFSFSKMPKQRIAEILNNNWSGKLFSERIWGRAAEVNKEIKHALLTGFMTGRSYRKTAKEIEERMAVGAMEARRLVRTESTYIANMAELESYKEGGVDKFRFLATLDMRTSAICASMDGKVFLTKDGVPGVNIPPLHPWCRSTTVPEIDGADLSAMKRRARDPKTGETYLVPGDMTYEEWRDTYVKTDARARAEFQKYRNEYADRNQHQRYLRALGGETPKSFDKFQDLKYNNREDYEKLKQLYRDEHKPHLQDQLAYVMPNGEKNFIPNRTIMSATKTIAGKGSKRALRVEQQLVELYGGNIGEWKKRVGKVESKKYIFDVHWYELNGKQYRMKLKDRSEKR